MTNELATGLDLLQTYILKSAEERHIAPDTSDPHERVLLLKDSIITIGSLDYSLGQALLAAMWQVFSEGLWASPRADGERYENFRAWVEGEVEPFVSSSLLWDTVRIVERTLHYTFTHLVADTVTGEVITPEKLIETPDLVKKLKETSSLFINPEPTETLDNLVRAIVTQPTSAIRELAQVARYGTVLKIPYFVADNGDGTYLIYTTRLSDNQVRLFRGLLGKAGDPMLMEAE